jgi:hypothetical protein
MLNSSSLGVSDDQDGGMLMISYECYAWFFLLMIDAVAL